MADMTMTEFDALPFGKGDIHYKSPQHEAIGAMEIGGVLVVDDTGCGGVSGECPTEDALVLVRRALNNASIASATSTNPAEHITKRFEIRHMADSKVAVACKKRE